MALVPYYINAGYYLYIASGFFVVFVGEQMSRTKVNKAAKIREMFEKLGPGARPRDVIAGLAEEKIEVSSAQVSNIKATLGAGGKRTGHGGISIDDLVVAKKFVEQLGSVERAEGVLAALVKLR